MSDPPTFLERCKRVAEDKCTCGACEEERLAAFPRLFALAEAGEALEKAARLTMEYVEREVSDDPTLLHEDTEFSTFVPELKAALEGYDAAAKEPT